MNLKRPGLPSKRKSDSTVEYKKAKRKRSRSKWLLIALSLITIISTGYFYRKYQSAVQNPQAQIEQKNSKETKDVVESLGKILLLPSDKQPTVAKVEDTEKLKKSNETFYKDVAKEDYLILYSDRAIIYRKKENKIINIAPIVDTSGKQPDKPADTKKSE